MPPSGTLHTGLTRSLLHCTYNQQQQPPPSGTGKVGSLLERCPPRVQHDEPKPGDIDATVRRHVRGLYLAVFSSIQVLYPLRSLRCAPHPSILPYLCNAVPAHSQLQPLQSSYLNVLPPKHHQLPCWLPPPLITPVLRQLLPRGRCPTQQGSTSRCHGDNLHWAWITSSKRHVKVTWVVRSTLQMLQ